MKCNVGDIVLVTHFVYPNGKPGSLHSFVIMDINKDEFELVNLDYLCFLIPSNISKSNDANSRYPYNEPILPTAESGLLTKSHVVCDVLYNIKENDIIMRVGSIDANQYKLFMDLYKKSLQS